METINLDQNTEGNLNIIDEKKDIDDNNNNNIYEDIFDVAIIGGGFAGQSAALLLGRYCRSTIIFDVAKPRQSYIHGYLGFEKSPRDDVIKKAWKDVLQYNSVKRINIKVEKVEKDNDNNFFLITTTKENNKNYNHDKDNNNNKNRKVRAKYLIIATGIEHLKPNIKNFEEYDGNGAWHCPHCDGFETINKKLIIIASNNNIDESLDYAKIFLGWTRDITLFLQGSGIKDEFKNKKNSDNNGMGYQLTNKQRNEASLLGINVIENTDISEIVGDSKTHIIKGVISKDGIFYKADVLFYHLETVIHNEIARHLGCELDEGYVKVNKKQQTSVPEIYAAGDIDTDRHYAILAAASGALAAISIYEELLKNAIKITKIESHA